MSLETEVTEGYIVSEFLYRFLPVSISLTKGPGKRGHIVADTLLSPFARARDICYGSKFWIRDTKNVSDFVEKHFVSAANVFQFAQPKKHHGQQCVLVYPKSYRLFSIIID